MSRVFALIALAGAIVSSMQAAQANDLVREAFPSTSANFLPNYIADKLGYYTQQNIDYQQMIIEPSIAVSAIIGGSAQISYAGATQDALAVQKGAKIYAVGISTDHQPYKLMTTPAIKTFKDLKGKRVAASIQVDIYTYVLKEILRKGGLDPERDVEWVFGGGQNQRFAAIESDAVQAGLYSMPGSTLLTNKGFNTLAFTPDYYPNLTLSVETVAADMVEKDKGDLLRRMLHAEAEAVRWMNDPANKEKAIQILSSATHSSAADSLEAYDYYVVQKNIPDACVHPGGMTNVVKIMRITGQLTSLNEADVPKFVKTDWCTKS